MIRKVFIAFSLLFFAVIAAAQDHSKWVDSVFNAMTLEQRLGQLFIFPTYGNSNEQHIKVIENLIDKYTLGGLHIIDGSPKNIVRLTNRLIGNKNLPLFTAINTENLGYKIADIPPFPKNIQLGALPSDSLIQLLSQEYNVLLYKMGFNTVWNSGLPLVDDQYNINSFSSDTAMAKERFQSLSAHLNNLLIGATNFPGISSDSQKNKKELVTENLTAFRNKDVSFITIPAVASSLDAKKIAPLSKELMQIVRKELLFEGLIVAESFDDYQKYKPGKTEAQAIETGVDMVISSNISLAVKQLKKAIRKGKVELYDIEKKVKKILSLKSQLENNALTEDNINLKTNSDRLKAILDQINKQSLVLVDPDNQLPISTLDNTNFASITDGSNQLTQRLSQFAFFSHFNWSTDWSKLKNLIANYETVIIETGYEMTNEKINFINSLDKNRNIVVIHHGDPYALKALNSSITIIYTLLPKTELQDNAAQIIFGALPASGKLPLHMSDQTPLGSGDFRPSLKRLAYATPYEVNMEGSVLNKIDDIAYEAIATKATPGCQVLVARKGKIIYHKAFGHYTYDSLRKVTLETIYDIASITKVAATTQAVMFMHERNLIDLDKKISVYLPELKSTNKQNMTIRDILTHQAGLWPYLPFWKRTIEDTLLIENYYKSEPYGDYQYQISDGMFASNLTRDSVWQWVKQSKLRKKEPGVPYDYRYSDMGYYMLQRVVESQLNQPMEEFLQQNFYDPLGLNSMSYLPLCRMPLSLIAPTEYDNYFRNTLVYGMVHDQGAAMMGGVAGHAGLFSNALDLAKLIQMNLWGGEYGNQNYFMNGTIDEFTNVQYESNRRGIGWDKPVVAELNSPTSPYASKDAFGHSGFTGTVVWADPEFDLVYVFLSNRIYPDASNTKLIKNNIRTRIQDLIYQSIFSFEATHGNH